MFLDKGKRYNITIKMPNSTQAIKNVVYVGTNNQGEFVFSGYSKAGMLNLRKQRVIEATEVTSLM